MARALALLLAALTVAADAARPRTTRALAVRGGSCPPPAPRSKAKKVKLADEPLAPKKKSKSKVKLAAKAKKAKKRGAIGTATLMTRAYWGSLFDPAYSPFPKKKKSNIHGVYDDDVSNSPARPHIASAGAGVPTSFGSAGGGGG